MADWWLRAPWKGSYRTSWNWRSVVERLKQLSRRRNFLLLLDTAATSLTTMVLVVVAARHLGSRPLSSFGLAQLVVVTTVGGLRAGVYSPALAAQLETGRAHIPLNWVQRVGLPLAVVVSACAGPFMGDGRAGWLKWSLVLLAALTCSIAQDGVRTVLVSVEHVRNALISDLAVLSVMVLLWVTGQMPNSPAGLLLYWAAAGLVGLVFGLLSLRRVTVPDDLPAQSIRAIWRLSKWAALDIALASVATLLPYFVATAALSADITGIYRTLQTALGPLNIVHTTVVTALGLDAWRLAKLSGLETVHRSVERLTALLTVGSLAYAIAAVILMVAVTGLDSPNLYRIAIIMIFTATLGAANSGFNAAALALGYQRSGAILRAIIVTVSVVISLPWAARTWVPWHDPIGVTAIVSAVVTFLGWAISYYVGYQNQRRHLLD